VVCGEYECTITTFTYDTEEKYEQPSVRLVADRDCNPVHSEHKYNLKDYTGLHITITETAV
jgi:hypothetical protein